MGDNLDYSGQIAISDPQTQMVKAIFSVTASALIASGAASGIADFTDPLLSRQSVSITNLDATNVIFVGLSSDLTSTRHWVYRLGDGENAVLQVGGQVEVFMRSDGGTPEATIVQLL